MFRFWIAMRSFVEIQLNVRLFGNDGFHDSDRRAEKMVLFQFLGSEYSGFLWRESAPGKKRAELRFRRAGLIHEPLNSVLQFALVNHLGKFETAVDFYPVRILGVESNLG